MSLCEKSRPNSLSHAIEPTVKTYGRSSFGKLKPSNWCYPSTQFYGGRSREVSSQPPPRLAEALVQEFLFSRSLQPPAPLGRCKA